jgi:hypothetical protein
MPLGNPTLTSGQLGVSAIACGNAASSFNSNNCTAQIIDTTQTDRPWITSDGPTGMDWSYRENRRCTYKQQISTLPLEC